MVGGKKKWHTGVLKGGVDSHEVVFNWGGHGSLVGSLVWIVHLGQKVRMTDCPESRVKKMEKTKIWRVGRNDRLSKKEVEGEGEGEIWKTYEGSATKCRS